MKRKNYTTTIDIELLNKFKRVCNSNKESMEDVLGKFMENYIDDFKDSKKNIVVEYNKILIEVLEDLIKSVNNKSDDKKLESMTLDGLFGLLYDRSKIQVFDRLSQLKKCKDDLSFGIDYKKYLLDEYIYYTISKKILDGIIISKDEIIKNINEINLSQ